MLYIIVFGLLALATSHSIVQSSDFNRKLVKFIKNVQSDRKSETLLILMESSDHNAINENFIKELLKPNFTVPLVISSGIDSFSLNRKFTGNFLAVVQLDSGAKLLQEILVYLQKRRSSRIILISRTDSFDEDLLKEIFQFCFQNDMINVIVVFRDFSTSSIFYRFTNFPEFKIEEIVWTDDDEDMRDSFFPERMRDLKSSILPVLLAGPEPCLIVSQNEQGQTKIGGYFGHVFNAFAKKHNAILNTSLINLKLSSNQIIDLVVNKTIEISASATFPNIIKPMDFFTYPCDYIDWCVMIPIEASIPVYKIFTFVWKWKALCITLIEVLVLSVMLHVAAHLSEKKSSLLNSLFNDSLRGLLGQSFIERKNTSYTTKILYSVIFISGIMFVTSYDAFLQTFMTSQPTKNKLETFDDLLASNLKVLGLKIEIELLFEHNPIFKTKYFNMFVLESDLSTFVKIRDTFNTSFAYAVNNVKWKIYQNQQKLFTKPLFRLPKQMCLMTNFQWAFPINENSIYKEILNAFLLETQLSGLLEFWKQRSFYELKEIEDYDLSAIVLEDLQKNVVR
ncbi:uncharacterized protein LOC129948321 [Eupeodes corollae]|uniref:uncharacterized protein LOC129948321 n=1 Tax=Eupeodes corollae TaxID=290404 RepID=UPI002492E444|nr:uncharacterized protein LOC129948321 [Eupeodes corollae]